MKPALTALLAILSLFPVIVPRAQSISTIAGTPTVYGFGGAGGPATSAVIGEPFSVVADNSGNIFFSDPNNNRIWKVNTAGIASVYAGTGVFGSTGDGGPATAAEISRGFFLSGDNAGNLYVIDNNYAVRKINAAGIISTIITSTQGAAAASTGDGGPLSAATFQAISAFVPDNAGNFYISEFNGDVVRKVNSAGIISTIAGTGVMGYSGDGGPATAAQLKAPYAVAFDNAGNIYIPDVGNTRIRKIDAAGVITTVAGNGTTGYSGDGGPATNAQLYGGWQVQCDASGNLYIGDVLNNCVRKVDNTGTISTYAGIGGNAGYGYSGDGGPATAAKITNVESIAIDNGGNIYIADNENYIIRKVSNCLFAQIAQQPVASTICAGGNTNFTLTATGSTGYQWQANTGTTWNDLTDGGAYGGSATNTLTITAALAGMNTTEYRCSITNACGAISTVPAILTVNTPSAPTVTITTTTASVCAGAPANFSASETNGGAAPAYQWLVNGLSTGATGPTYTDGSLNNGDQVSCILTSNATCTTTPTAASNTLTMTVNPLVTPAISVSGPSGPVCAGASANFSANATNGGSTPAYQWQLNGLSTGATGPTYAAGSLNNGDVVSCVLTSNAVCATTPTATSNTLTMTVNPIVTPAVSIAGPSGPVCANAPANFSASATNGGSTPAYQWQVNGLSTGATGPSYAAGSLNNGDLVSCVLTSNADCVTTPTAVSNTVTMTVNPLVTPAVSIATTTPSICVGSQAGFTASPTNGGAAPVYQWFVNGLSTGATGPTYASGALNNGDLVSCVLTSNADCATAPTAVSNTIAEQVAAVPSTSVTVAASSSTTCSGNPVSFTATPANGGASPAYQWQVNGGDVGSGNAVFTTSDLSNGDVISCILTSSLSCSTPTASQNQVVMTVNANPTVVVIPDTIIALGQSVLLKTSVTGPVTSYQWTPAIGLNNPNTAAPAASPENTTTYQVVVATATNCTASGEVTISVFKTLRMPGAFTPNGDGNNDIFRIPPSEPLKISAFSIYGRWGTRVFYTSNSAVGWDGTAGGQPLPTGTYVWVIDYQDLLTGKNAEAKGTVVLMR
jgi:gliding motility-associated-like protein